MKREDIDIAAKNYVNRLWDNGIMESSKEFDNVWDSFVKGAEWRINSIWHDAKEAANQTSSILIYNKYGVMQLNYTGYFSDWDKYVKIYNIVKWAYIEDLLPTTD